MKKPIITLLFLAASFACFAQNASKTSAPAKTPSDTTSKKKPVFYVDAPGKVFEITLKVKADSLWLLNFAISNAPLMETNIPASTVKRDGLTLQQWYLEIERQRKQQHLADSTKAANSKPQK